MTSQEPTPVGTHGAYVYGSVCTGSEHQLEPGDTLLGEGPFLSPGGPIPEATSSAFLFSLSLSISLSFDLPLTFSLALALLPHLSLAFSPSFISS